jgi:hypothetical protein
MALNVACAAALTLLLQGPANVVPGTHHQLPRRARNGGVSDAELLAYSRRPFDKAETMNRTIVLGTHRGTQVVAEFPCGDLCPESTGTIIRYELKSGEACAKRGGVVEQVFVSQGPGLVNRELCVPRILARKKQKAKQGTAEEE